MGCAVLMTIRLKLYAAGATDPGLNIPWHPTDPTCPIKVVGRSIKVQGAVTLNEAIFKSISSVRKSLVSIRGVQPRYFVQLWLTEIEHQCDWPNPVLFPTLRCPL